MLPVVELNGQPARGRPILGVHQISFFSARAWLSWTCFSFSTWPFTGPALAVRTLVEGGLSLIFAISSRIQAFQSLVLDAAISTTSWPIAAFNAARQTATSRDV